MLRIFQPPGRELTHQKIYSRIGKFLTEHGLCPSPENYSLVHQLVVDGDSAVSKEVKRLVSDGIRLSQEEADRIRTEFGISRVASTEQVDETAVAAAKLLLQQFGETIEQARADTQSYGRDLEEGAAALESADAQAGLGSLIRITGAILERTRAAEQRLVQAESETETLRRQLVVVEEEARKDPLTDLANRRAFEDRCRELDAKATPASIAICDLDHFKMINDSHGHSVGDRVLRMMAKRLKRACAGHMVARLGGEEFVILFEGLTPSDAAAKVERARRSLMRRDFVLRGTGERIGKVTFSAGIAGCSGGATQGLMRADELLYEAKNEGRNRVRVDD